MSQLGAKYYTVKLSNENIDSNSPNLALISENHHNNMYQVPDIEAGKTHMYALFTNDEFQLTIKLKYSTQVAGNEVLLTREHMSFLGIQQGKKVKLESVTRNFSNNVWGSEITFKAYHQKFEETGSAYDINATIELGKELEIEVQKKLLNQVLHSGQKICLSSNKKLFMVVVTEVKKGEEEVKFGGINRHTILIINKFDQSETFRPGVDPDELGPELRRKGIIGMRSIFKKLLDEFKFKFLPLNLQLKLGLELVHGILLHGPPGLGKTVVAQNLCKILLCVTPRLVNGRALLASTNRYSDMQSLYDSPKKDLKKYGSSSPLHVIIFDDIDPHQLNKISFLRNLLVLATANTEAIDRSLLRGVFERYIYVGFPERHERIEILRQEIELFGDLIDEGFDIDQIADLTERFTRPDLHSLCMKTLRKLPADETEHLAGNRVGTGRLGLIHFQASIEEMRNPAA